MRQDVYSRAIFSALFLLLSANIANAAPKAAAPKPRAPASPACPVDAKLPKTNGDLGYIPVLGFHEISFTNTKEDTMTAENFVHLLNFLADNGIEVVPLSEVHKQRKPGRKNFRQVAITFDDSIKGQSYIAANLLDPTRETVPIPKTVVEETWPWNREEWKQHDRGIETKIDAPAEIARLRAMLHKPKPLPATFFAVPQWLDSGAHNSMTWEQLDAISTNPVFTIGSHSDGHIKDWEKDGTPLDFYRREVENAAQRLRDRYQRPIESFAYPYDAYGPEISDEVAKHHRYSVGGSEVMIKRVKPDYQIPRVGWDRGGKKPGTKPNDAASIKKLEDWLKVWLAGKVPFEWKCPEEWSPDVKKSAPQVSSSTPETESTPSADGASGGQ